MLMKNQLDDKSLFHETSLLNGKWVSAKSGEVFDVEGKESIPVLGSLGSQADFAIIS